MCIRDRTWQITSDEVLSWDQMYRILGEELGREPKIVHIPTDILVKIGMDSGLRGDKEASVIFDNAKIKKLGFVPHVSFREGVRLSLIHISRLSSAIPQAVRITAAFLSGIWQAWVSKKLFFPPKPAQPHLPNSGRH